MTKFQTSRESGKSDADILVEMVECHKPGDVFTFEELISAFEKDTNRVITRANVSSVVSSAKKRLLRDADRTLISVRKVGYRIALAGEHVKVSACHKDRGRRQINRAWDTLEHVKRGEMSKEELARHSQEMVKTGEMLVVLEQHESRLNKIEKVLIEARKSGKL